MLQRIVTFFISLSQNCAHVLEKYHPCLWNPHHAKYYDCLAKNEALKNIIKNFNMPGLSVSDCLEQIKVIRKKYGQEQIRIIKGLHSQKVYESPFSWFSIIAEMLAKVMNDEGKLQSRRRSLKMSVESGTNKSCITPYNKYTKLLSLPYAEIKEYTIKSLQAKQRDYKAKARKNTKFTRTGYTLKDSSKLDLLQCPSCGWEDIKSNKFGTIVEKAFEQRKPLDITIPCSKYANLADLANKTPCEDYNCNLYRNRMKDDQEKYNTVPCPGFVSNLSSYPKNTLRKHVYYPGDTCGFINQQMTRQPIFAFKPEFCVKETQLLNRQLLPKKSTKQIGTVVECCNKDTQYTICTSETNATSPSSKCVITLKTSKYTEVDTVQKCHKQIQSKLLVPQENLRHVAVNNVQCNTGIQNTICTSVINLNNCQTVDKISSTIEDSKQIDRKTVECPTNTRNIIGKEEYSALDDKKLVENTVCVKGTCSHEEMKIVKQKSIVAETLLQCLERIMRLQDKVKTHSITSVSSKKDNVEYNSSEETICEPCKFANDNVNFVTSSTIKLDSPSCLPCLEEIEKYNVVGMLTETFLEIIKHIIILDSKRHINIQKGCVREDPIDTLDVLNKIKECADKILQLYTIGSCSKKPLCNKYCPRYKWKDKCPPKTKIDSSSIQTQVSQKKVAHTHINSNDVELLYKPSKIITEIHSPLKNHTKSVETAMEERFSVKNKETTTSQVLLQDSGTQYASKQLQETGVATEHNNNFEKKISIGTQKCEPILFRIIKCNNSEGILKLDKETCVRDIRVAWAKNIDKCIETCPMLYLPKDMYHRKFVRECYDERHPDLPRVREKEVKRIDYHTFLSSNKNYKHEGECEIPLSYNQDWSKINFSTVGLSSNQYFSRIPLYTGVSKYIRRMNMHRISQSYV